MMEASKAKNGVLPAKPSKLLTVFKNYHVNPVNPVQRKK